MIIGFGPTLFFKAISPGPTSDWPESAVVSGKSTTAAIVSFSSASKVVLQLFFLSYSRGHLHPGYPGPFSKPGDSSLAEQNDCAYKLRVTLLYVL